MIRDLGIFEVDSSREQERHGESSAAPLTAIGRLEAKEQVTRDIEFWRSEIATLIRSYGRAL